MRTLSFILPSFCLSYANCIYFLGDMAFAQTASVTAVTGVREKERYRFIDRARETGMDRQTDVQRDINRNRQREVEEHL